MKRDPELKKRPKTEKPCPQMLRHVFVIPFIAMVFAGNAASAATVIVTVAPNSGHFFDPAIVTIQPGDTVKWVWDDNNHTVTSGDISEEIARANGMFDSGNKNKGSEFSFSFQNRGDVTYYCAFHHSMGMDRTVKVTGSTPLGTVGNVSTRLPIGTDDNVLIEGFIVQGPSGSTKKMIVRAIGPSLAAFGINGAVANPTLEIHDANNVTVATNNDWKTTQIGGLITGDQVAEINASQVAPGNDLESAIIANLAPGSYTAVVRGGGNTTGTGVVDAYDLSSGSQAKLANISTRGLIQPADKLMIAGFIVQGASPANDDW